MRILVLVVSIFVLFSAQVHASDPTVPFSVQANLPENQIDTSVTYFSLGMSPGDSQTLEVMIHNSSNDPIEVEVSSNFAGTNSNGVIVYDGSIESYDESMTYAFDEISEVQESTIIVPPASTEVALIDVEIPDEPFEGMILGGIYVEQLQSDEDEDGAGMSISNVYSYSIAVMIQDEDNMTEIAPEMDVVSSGGALVNHRTAYQTVLANRTPVLISKATIEAGVYREDGEMPMFHRRAEDFNIAPNAEFSFPVMADNRPLEAGSYVVRGTVTTEDDFEYEFEESFMITTEQAQETNVAAVELEQPTEDNTLMYILIGVGAVIILCLLVLIIVMAKRKK